MDNINV
jgi:ERCC4-type nuclease